MTSLPLAHVAGIPIEETLASFTPALVLMFGAASATIRARLRRARSPASMRTSPSPRVGCSLRTTGERAVRARAGDRNRGRKRPQTGPGVEVS